MRNSVFGAIAGILSVIYAPEVGSAVQRVDLSNLDPETIVFLWYIFNVLASNMPPPSGNEWYRFLYKVVQSIAANWENFRVRGAKKHK